MMMGHKTLLNGLVLCRLCNAYTLCPPTNQIEKCEHQIFQDFNRLKNFLVHFFFVGLLQEIIIFSLSYEIIAVNLGL